MGSLRCRLCGTPVSMGTTSLFSTPEGSNSTLSEQAMSCARIEILSGDGLPDSACDRCSLQVSAFYQFKLQCEAYDKYFRALLTDHKVKIEFDLDVEIKYEPKDPLKKDHSTDHIFQSENSPSPPENDSKVLMLRCNCCNRAFNNKTKLRKHLMASGKPTKLKVASKTRRPVKWIKPTKYTNNPDSLLDLKEDVEPDKLTKKFMCDVCGNLFKNYQIMIQHQQTHSNEKLFSCDICKKKFSRNSHVASHMRIHNNIKPYICESCGRSFVKSSDLARHRRIHSSAKNYSCPLCGKTFRRSTDVTSHLRTHTGDRPYTCKCGKAYTSHSSLRKHRKLNCFGKSNGSTDINSKTEVEIK